MKNSAKVNEYSLLAQGKKAQPKISIVMPIHNEESFLPATVSDICDSLRKEGIVFELILCENGSTDGTVEIAKGLAEELDDIQILSAPVADYGKALRAGMLASRAQYVFVFDVDYYSISFLKTALELLKRYDIVIASKLIPEAEDKRGLLRKTVTRGFSVSLKTLFNVKVKETHGMKAFRRSKIKHIIERTRLTKDLFDTELVIRAEKYGLNIIEVPTVVEEKRPARSSIFKRIPRTIVGLALLRYYLWSEQLTR